MCRYLQERIRQVEDERGHALTTIAKYKVLIHAIVTWPLRFFYHHHHHHHSHHHIFRVA